MLRLLPEWLHLRWLQRRLEPCTVLSHCPLVMSHFSHPSHIKPNIATMAIRGSLPKYVKHKEASSLEIESLDTKHAVALKDGSLTNSFLFGSKTEEVLEPLIR